MNKNLQTVYHYHETTKHTQHRYARSLGYMDWSTQPDPFREYKGTQTLQLPLAMDHTTPPYHLIDHGLPAAPLCIESISQLLQFSMGLAAWKESGGSRWAVRCNASSGNLHPTESYLILPPILKEQDGDTSVFHYRPRSHDLELLAQCQTSFWDKLPEDSFLVGFSTITWREVWKYGERAFRYCHLDTGHAWQALVLSAKMLGWKVTRLDSVSDDDLNTLLGLGQKDRFFESEHGDLLCVVSPYEVSPRVSIDELVSTMPLRFDGIANRLSPSMQKWEIIPAIEDATKEAPLPQKMQEVIPLHREPTQESKHVVLNRRSIHVMDKERSRLSRYQFQTLMQSVTGSLDGKQTAVHLVMFIHQVEALKSGIYILIRNSAHRDELKELMHSDFLWKETDYENVYLLQEGDFKAISKAVSCNQDIASDGAFSLGMLSQFSQQLREFGPHRYKELYWECGAIGQQLYVEATSMKLSGTGIGCFLDDMFHELLGLKDDRFQTLYHFTVGRGYVDSRIMTQPAY